MFITVNGMDKNTPRIAFEVETVRSIEETTKLLADEGTITHVKCVRITFDTGLVHFSSDTFTSIFDNIRTQQAYLRNQRYHT